MAQIIEVGIPDGVGPGDEFLVEFNGTQFNIGVPDGCGPGDMIQVEVPGGAEEPAADAGAEAPPQVIEVGIPDGVGPGDEFLVEFNGTQFNIGVPDGCGPGDMIQVEVPGAAPEPTAEPPAEPAAEPPEREMSNLRCSDTSASTSHAGRSSSKNEASSSRGGSSSSSYSKYSNESKYNPFDYDSHYKYDPPPKWEPEPSVFDGGFVLAGEHAEPCGDFAVGQLVQVTRTDGSWTYGKIQEYDAGGDTYTVHTKMGPKYFVERADLTDDIVTNPSDGSCAQQ